MLNVECFCFPNKEMEDLLKTAIKVCIDAGKEIQSASLLKKTINSKENVTDLVTNTDKNIERQIFSLLRTKYPDHSFLGEESSTIALLKFPSGYLWILDPVDGVQSC